MRRSGPWPWPLPARVLRLTPQTHTGLSADLRAGDGGDGHAGPRTARTRGRGSRPGDPTAASWRHLQSALRGLPRPGRPRLGPARSLTLGVPSGSPPPLLDSALGEAQELPCASGAERPRSPQLPPHLPLGSAVPPPPQERRFLLTGRRVEPRRTTPKWGDQAATLTLGRLELACHSPAHLHHLPHPERWESPAFRRARPTACLAVPRNCCHLFNTVTPEKKLGHPTSLLSLGPENQARCRLLCSGLGSLSSSV